MYKPKFTITPQINSNIAEIERLRTIIERSKILPTKEGVLRKRAIIEATRSSTGIEGNPLNEKEVAQVLIGQKINASERFINEVINYKKALDFIEKRSSDSTPITSKEILNLHKIVMQNLLPASKVGKFRKTPVYVVNLIGNQEIVRYTGPDYKDVDNLIEDLLLWLKENGNKLHSLLSAGILHCEFVSIHPFADGNGRVTRLLTMLHMHQKGYTFRKVLVPDSYYFSNRPKYYDALNRVQGQNYRQNRDVTSWLEYFTEGLLVVAREVVGKVTIISQDMSLKDVLTLAEEDYQIIDLISNFGKADINNIVSSLNIPRRTAQRRLLRMIKGGLIKRLGKGRSIYYQLKKPI